MTTYIVIASNKFFWQELCVDATSADQASVKFDDYLSGDQQKADEKYEYDEQVKHVNGSLDGDEVEQPDPSDYSYGFDADEIEERDDIVSSGSVHVVQSGGNG